MTIAPVPVSHLTLSVGLTTTQVGTLAEIPPKLEGFANLTTANPRRAYRQDIKDSSAFTNLHRLEQFHDMTHAHVIAWRQQLSRQGLASDTVRRKVAAMSSFYAYPCERPSVWHTPVLGIQPPRSINRQGVASALGDHHARLLLKAPPAKMLKGRLLKSFLPKSGAQEICDSGL